MFVHLPRQWDNFKGRPCGLPEWTCGKIIPQKFPIIRTVIRSTQLSVTLLRIIVLLFPLRSWLWRHVSEIPLFCHVSYHNLTTSGLALAISIYYRLLNTQYRCSFQWVGQGRLCGNSCWYVTILGVVVALYIYGFQIIILAYNNRGKVLSCPFNRPRSTMWGRHENPFAISRRSSDVAILPVQRQPFQFRDKSSDCLTTLKFILFTLFNSEKWIQKLPYPFRYTWQFSLVAQFDNSNLLPFCPKNPDQLGHTCKYHLICLECPQFIFLWTPATSSQIPSSQPAIVNSNVSCRQWSKNRYRVK
jgi:hypothetical protein